MKRVCIFLVITGSVHGWFENYYAQKAYEAGDLKTAQELYKKQILSNENDVTALFNLATTSEKLGEHDKAVEYYTALLDDTTIDGTIREKTLYNRSHTFAQRGQYQESLQDIETILEKNPTHEKALHDKKIIEALQKEKEEQQKQQHNQQQQPSQNNNQEQEDKKDSSSENQQQQSEQQKQDSKDDNTRSDDKNQQQKQNESEGQNSENNNSSSEGSNNLSEEQKSSSGENNKGNQFEQEHDKQQREKEGQQSGNERGQQEETNSMQQDKSGMTDQTKEQHETEGDGADKVERLQSGDKESGDDRSSNEKRGDNSTDDHKKDSLIDEQPAEKDFSKVDEKGQHKKQEALYAQEYEDQEKDHQASSYDSLLKQVEIISNQSGKQFLKRSLNKNTRTKHGQKNW